MELDCKYRTINKICVNKRCFSSRYFCIKHRNINNVVFDYCVQLFGDKEILDYYDILVLYQELYIKYGMYEAQNILGTLIARRKADLFPIAIQAGMIVRNKSLKRNVLETFNKKIHLTIILSNNKKIKKVFSKLWGIWKGYLDRINGSVLGHAINTTDIFTLDDIDKISYPFKIKDTLNNIVLVFDTLSLYKYINDQKRTNEDNVVLNPYNRSPISTDVYIRLCKYIHILNLYVEKEDNFQKWQTIDMAYTDVVLAFDRAGFYTSVEWFNTIEYLDIVNVLKQFHEYCIMFHYDNNCMIDEEMINEYPDCAYRFCNLCLNLLEKNDFGYTTILFRSLMDKVNIFRRNTPEWINSITL